MSKSIFISGAAFFVAIIIMFGSWYTIDQTERGVITRNGAISGTAEPGLHFKIPIIDSVNKISMQTSKIHAVMESYSRDQQPASITVSVTYHVNSDSVEEVYSEFQNVDNLIDRTLSPRINQATKTVFGKFSASESIQERGKLNKEVLDAIISESTELVTIESVQIENIDFSDTYEKSVEARMLAEVGVQKAKQEWEQEKIKADITVTQAEASAKAVKLAGDAEAYAIQKKGEALRTSPELVPLTAAQRWNGVLPTTMIPDTGVPMINLDKK
ncbi:MAG: prohibitin family protein [Gammaproteobacteria bacterium]|nr:prohibitin family protein [Gammaproteobacteria bacterium]MBM2830682.1 prohibitin family protein [Gammaproteobacteria bacterium]